MGAHQVQRLELGHHGLRGLIVNAAEQYLASVIGQQALEIAGLRQQLAEKERLCAKLGAEVETLKAAKPPAD